MAGIGRARRILGGLILAVVLLTAARLVGQNASWGISTGIEASNYLLLHPGALAYDSSGNLFLADTGNHRILEIESTGVVVIIAGTGEQGFDGDGAAATSALLDSPAGIAFDSSGNLYIADTHNQRIRKVRGGIITTVAGTGVAGYSGEGVSATASMLNHPTAVAVDAAGTLYIADTGNHRVRVLSGGVLNTVAGSGDQGYLGDGGAATSAWLDAPNGIAIDANLDLYISDTHNQRIRKVTHATGLISTIAGDGQKGFNGDGAGTSASLARPRGLSVNSAGNIVIADSDNQRIRTLANGQLSTLAGDGQQGFAGDTGASSSAQLDTPRAVALSQGTAAVADTGNNAIRTVVNGGANTVGGSPTNAGESLTLAGPVSTTYGTGTLTASFANGGKTASGSITVYDGLGASPESLGAVALSSNQAAFITSTLKVGTHFITVSYPGDSDNAAIVSRTYVMTTSPAALTAVANAASMHYGASVPVLSGTLAGVLAQDSGKVTALYSTTATSSSAPGSYPITAALSGTAAGNYQLSMGTGSGSVTVSSATSSTVLHTSNAAPAYGESVTLTATVSPEIAGTPTGTVTFYNNGAQLGGTASTLSQGVASLSLNTLPIGSSSLSAVYNGDSNFTSSTSASISTSIAAPVLVAAQSSLNFGSQPLGATSDLQTVIVSNPYGLPVSVSSVAADGDFKASSNCPSIAAFGTCSIGVTFTPTAQGSRTGTLSVSIAQASTILQVSLSGTGAAAGIRITPSAIDFGSQVVSTSSFGQPLSIENTGNADLILSSVQTTGDYVTSGNCATVQAGSQCSLTVTFRPAATGTRAGTITLTDNLGGATQSQVVKLTGVGIQAGATLLPAKQSFPDTMVGSSSLALSITLTNTGTASLTGIGASIQGDFTQTSTCGTTLAASAKCTFSIVFTPTLNGSESGLLTVTNSLGTQTVTLTGTGIAPGALLSTDQLLFGSQLVNTTSSAQTVNFTNAGTAPLTIVSMTLSGPYSSTSNCSSQLAVNASCSINVLFTPASIGQQSGTLTITSNAGSGVQTVSLLGQGVAPGLSIAPSPLNFGSQPVSTISLAQTLIATNTGTAPLTLGSATISNNFAETSQCDGLTLQAGATCSISVSFLPTATGALQGTLVLGNQAGTNTVMVPLAGQGTLPGVANSPSSLSFGSKAIGTTSRAQTITVSNHGDAPLLIGTVSSTGDFAETDNCAGQTLAAGAYCVISVTMTPSTVGTRTGQIQFTNNADGMHMIALSGVGQQAGVDISPTSLSFGSSPLGRAAAPLSITVTNTGSAPLLLTKMTVTTDYSLSSNCGSEVAAGSSCTVAVTFTPSVLGHSTGTLTLTDNAGGGTQIVSLEGYGSQAGLILSPSVMNFGVQRVGIASSIQRATLTNQTGVTLSNLSITASGEYYVESACPATLQNGGSCGIRVWVIPEIQGAITGTINVTYALPTSSGNTVLPRSLAMSSSSSGSTGSGVVSLLVTGNNNANPPAKLAFTATPAATVVAGGNAGAFVTVQENDSTGNPTSATDTITLTVSGPSGYAKSYTAAASGGLALFDLSSASLTATGSYLYTASLSGVSSASALETVIAATPASVAALAGSGQSTAILSAFSSPLQVLVKDSYGNPVSGASVQFSAPASGASVSLSSNPVLTDSNGLASTTATANASVGTFTVVASSGSATTASFTLTSTAAQPTVTLTATPTPVFLLTAVNYTATVTGSAGTPTGTVSFLDGGTLLGTATLNSAGVATAQFALSTAGTHSVTAVYAATTPYMSATSNAVPVTAQDFAFTASGISSMTVRPGETALYTFSIAPLNGTTLPAAIALTAAGAPAGASLTLSTASIAAGNSATTVTLSITVPGDALVQKTEPISGRRVWPFSLAILLLPLAALRRGRRIFFLLLLLVAGWGLTSGLTGCTLRSGYFGQAPKSFTITVTGASGALTHAADVTLNVQ